MVSAPVGGGSDSGLTWLAARARSSSVKINPPSAGELLGGCGRATAGAAEGGAAVIHKLPDAAALALLGLAWLAGAAPLTRLGDWGGKDHSLSSNAGLIHSAGGAKMVRS